MSEPRSGPLFVVGAPRSGTTLLLEMLNRHPALWLCEETYYLHFVWGRRRRLGNLGDPSVRQRVVRAYLDTNRIKHQDVDLRELTAALMEEGTSYAALFESLMRFCARAHGRPRHGEKTPDHARRAALLCDTFPDCALIHIVRDPRDVVASLLRMPWGDRSVLANARQWLDCNSGALRCEDRLHYLRVVYEDLVADPESELGRICAFVGEEYSPRMLETGEEGDAHRWWLGRARTSIDRTRAERWRSELTVEQAGLVEWLTGDVMRRTGYEPVTPPPTAAQIARARAAALGDRVRWTFRRLPGMYYYWLRPDAMAKEEATIRALA